MGNGNQLNVYDPQERTYDEIYQDISREGHDFRIIDIKCGSWHSLVRSASGHVFYWGFSTYMTPTHMNFEQNEIVAMEAGDGFSILLDKSGFAWIQRPGTIELLASKLLVTQITAKYNHYSLVYANNTFDVFNSVLGNIFMKLDAKYLSQKVISVNVMDIHVIIVYDDGVRTNITCRQYPIHNAYPIDEELINKAISVKPRRDATLCCITGYYHTFLYWTHAWSRDMYVMFEILKRQKDWTPNSKAVVPDVVIFCDM
jgi:hypothetical protein